MNFGARVCPEMFLVGGWVLPELQQICGVQFGSGTNPGGHLTVSFGATVIFCVDSPLEYFHTHLPHFRLCVSEILWPSLMHVAQTLSFHLVSMGSLQSTWKARGEDSDSYLFILSTFE